MHNEGSGLDTKYRNGRNIARLWPTRAYSSRSFPPFIQKQQQHIKPSSHRMDTFTSSLHYTILPTSFILSLYSMYT